MNKWHLFDRSKPPIDPGTRERLEAKVRELQRELGIDDDALRALQRRLQMEVEMLEQMRGRR